MISTRAKNILAKHNITDEVLISEFRTYESLFNGLRNCGRQTALEIWEYRQSLRITTQAVNAMTEQNRSETFIAYAKLTTTENPQLQPAWTASGERITLTSALWEYGGFGEIVFFDETGKTRKTYRQSEVFARSPKRYLAADNYGEYIVIL